MKPLPLSTVQVVGHDIVVRPVCALGTCTASPHGSRQEPLHPQCYSLSSGAPPSCCTPLLPPPVLPQFPTPSTPAVTSPALAMSRSLARSRFHFMQGCRFIASILTLSVPFSHFLLFFSLLCHPFTIPYPCTCTFSVELFFFFLLSILESELRTCALSYIPGPFETRAH